MRDDVLRLTAALVLLGSGAHVAVRAGTILGAWIAGTSLPGSLPYARGPDVGLLAFGGAAAAAGWYYQRRWLSGRYRRRRAVIGFATLMSGLVAAGFAAVLCGFRWPWARWPAVVLVTVSLAPGLVPALYVACCVRWRGGRWVWDDSTRRCGECGYDLRGSPGPRCPECGAAFDPGG